MQKERILYNKVGRETEDANRMIVKQSKAENELGNVGIWHTGKKVN